MTMNVSPVMSAEFSDTTITEAETKAVVEPDGVTDDLGSESVSAIAGCVARHRPTLPAPAST